MKDKYFLTHSACEFICASKIHGCGQKNRKLHIYIYTYMHICIYTHSPPPKRIQFFVVGTHCCVGNEVMFLHSVNWCKSFLKSD